MALEERLVDRHALDADDRLVRDGSPRRGRPAGTDSGAGSAPGSRRCRWPGAALAGARSRSLIPCPPPWPGRPPCATARRFPASTASAAGRESPPQVSPAGTSLKTPAAAPRVARPPPMSTWSATPARPPNMHPVAHRHAAGNARCRPPRRSCGPSATLWATWTRLSILVFSPITVSSKAPRSMQLLAPMRDPVLQHHPAQLGAGRPRPWPRRPTPKPASPITAPARTRAPDRRSGRSRSPRWGRCGSRGRWPRPAR